MYDDRRVPPPAPRRGGEPRPSGSAWEHVEPDHAADPAARRRAPARAHHARRRRGVAARAARGSASTRALVAGDQARRAPRVVLPPHGVLRARCWGSCAPSIWTRRSTSPTARRSASRAGSSRLDDREIDRWLDRVEAGNLYVNRPITGAIVGRQPFGGWKASSVGPGAKVGGPRLRASARPLAPGDRDRTGETRRVAQPVSASLEPLSRGSPMTSRRRHCCGQARQATPWPGSTTSAVSTIPCGSSASATCSATGPCPGVLVRAETVI